MACVGKRLRVGLLFGGRMADVSAWVLSSVRTYVGSRIATPEEE